MTYKDALKNIGKKVRTITLDDSCAEEYESWEGVLEGVKEGEGGPDYVAFIRITRVNPIFKKFERWKDTLGGLETWVMGINWDMELAEEKEFDDEENR